MYDEICLDTYIRGTTVNSIGNQRRIIVYVLLCVGSFFISSCASQMGPKEQPVAQTIRLPDPKAAASGLPTTLEQTIKKELFNIHLSPQGIKVNGTKLADIKALEAFLAKQSKPVITIATHRCYSSARAAEVMNLARLHTDTPIAFGSFGDFSDPECQ